MSENADLVKRLQRPDGKIEAVLDTDAYNEIDDQFALAYMLRSADKVDLKAVYAAPFHNQNSKSPEDGMEKSYNEILKILGLAGRDEIKSRVFKGSRTYLPDEDTPVVSDAARDLAERATGRSPEKPLYVVAIGAVTNVASAILMEPEIITRIVVVWLGGHALHWSDTREFNLWQDPDAARVVFDSGVPLVQIPVMGVCSHLHTTIPELEAHVAGRGAIGDYLVETVRSYHSDHFPVPTAWSKVIWDISAVAYLLNESWTPTHLVHSPIVTEQGTWSFDSRRHLIRSAYHVNRDPIFADLFRKLDRFSQG